MFSPSSYGSRVRLCARSSKCLICAVPPRSMKVCVDVRTPTSDFVESIVASPDGTIRCEHTS